MPNINIDLDLLAKYGDKKAAGIVKLRREIQDCYEIVIPQYDPTTRAPVRPIKLPMDRPGAKAMAEGLRKSKEDLQKQITQIDAAIATLTGQLLADMDAADAEAKAAGDL
jgi:hypothetical protein